MDVQMNLVIFSVAIFGWQIASISGHGMLLDPVSRSSRWRVDSSATPNFDDNALYCGGFNTQWNVNGGKCGLCGDNYADAKPRANEDGGKYGQGVIVDTYTVGQTISIGAFLTANHKGYFLYDLCNLDGSKESDECFALHKLKLENGQDRYKLPNEKSNVFFNATVNLPSDVNCKHCVLRWTYVAGNSWGHCDDGTDAVGCGPQETFRGCSDIRITAAPKMKINKNMKLPSRYRKLFNGGTDVQSVTGSGST